MKLTETNGNGTKKGDGNIGIFICLALMATLFFTRFGTQGIRIIIGLSLFVYPIYAMLTILGMDRTESIVLSIFLCIGIMSTLVYFLGMIISLRLSVVLAMAVLIGASLLSKRLIIHQISEG